MALISDGRFIEDGWRRLADEEALPKSGKVIVSLAAAGARPRPSSAGRDASASSFPTRPNPPRSRARCRVSALIEIAFPAFADGRGFSLARLIRRAGFKGELRASGRLLADQYAPCARLRLRHDRNSRRSRRASGRSRNGAPRARPMRGPISAAMSAPGSILDARRKAATQ